VNRRGTIGFHGNIFTGNQGNQHIFHGNNHGFLQIFPQSNDWNGGFTSSKRTKSLLWKPWPICSDSDLMVMSSSVRLPKTAIEKTWIYPGFTHEKWWMFPHCKRWPEATPVRIPSPVRWGTQVTWHGDRSCSSWRGR
jgi:hypothetical protein